MTTLPSWIVDLASSAKLQRQDFSRESDLDALVINQRELLTDLLIENDFMEDTSTLRFIGRQLQNVDVLFAEVDDEGEPLRLVLVENKLLKNPESKRRVIGQIIEYAARFQHELRADDLARQFPEQKEWVKDHAELLDRQLERGDFLLVICGDAIHANVADVVTRLARRADRHPLSGMELCLVSMALYADATRRVLVPHLVGLVARAERQLQISVVDEQGRPRPATAAFETAPRERSTRPKPNRSEEEFFREVWAKKYGQQSVEQWHSFVGRVRDAEIPGFELSTTSAGRPTIELRSRIIDTTLPVLRPRKTAAGVRDVVDSKTWRRDPKLVQARDRFRAAIARIEGVAPNAGGTMMISIASSASHAEELISALRQLADDLESE
jgi:hypothetical protein